MKAELKKRILPNGSTKYIFFGGKGGVGKTTTATATAIWLADHGYDTTIVSTDPTVSLSVVLGQGVAGHVFLGSITTRSEPRFMHSTIQCPKKLSGLEIVGSFPHRRMHSGTFQSGFS